MKTITSKEYLPVPRFFQRELSTYHFLAPLARGWGGEGGRKWVLSPLLYANFPKQTWEGGEGGKWLFSSLLYTCFPKQIWGEGRGRKVSTFVDYLSSPAFQNKYGFPKNVWNSENGLYKKKLSSFTRHQITKSLFSLHRSNYIVISGNQKDLSISYANK